MGALSRLSPTSKSRRCEGGVTPREWGSFTGLPLLAGAIKPAGEVSGRERDRMYALMRAHFTGVSRRKFEVDLAEKEWVVILKNRHGQIQGFSTLMRLGAVIERQPVVAFYSGDTIIARPYWGATTLPRLWSRHVFALAEALAGMRVYWFLISSGYRTYRFLPTFFHEFYPRCDRATPAPVKNLIDALADEKFGGDYERERGIIRFDRATPLRGGVAELSEPRMKDPHTAFFVAANPGHARGDELACVAELTASNLTAAGRRMLGLGPDAEYSGRRIGDLSFSI